MNKYTKLFADFLHTMDFGLCKKPNGYALIDYQGAYWGGIAEDRFDSAESIVDRLDIYIDDYFLDDLEEEAPNYGISDETIVDILGFADWFAWFTENKDKAEYQKFINTHGFEFEVADLVVNHLDEVCLDDVVDKEE